MNLQNGALLEAIIHEQAAIFNFEEIRTPIMEQTELIKRGIGQLTDIVTKEIFAFTKGDHNYVLRPELTAPVVRSYVQHHLAQRGGLKNSITSGLCFVQSDLKKVDNDNFISLV